MRPLETYSAPFLGWEPGWHFRRRGWIVGTPEDHVGVVGVPRIGKTAGILIPQALLWDGPLVMASTKPEVLELTGDRRETLARERGGGIHLYSPTLTSPLIGLRPLRWSPLAGCEDPAVAKSRARALVYSSAPAKGVSDGTYWQAAGARLLQGLLHAAAVGGHDIRRVKIWLGRDHLEEPAQVLDRSTSPARELWAQDMRGISRTPPKERGSYFAQARQALDALDLPSVVENSLTNDLDLNGFLQSRSTLYVIAPTNEQSLVAPLVAAVLEDLVEHAYKLWNARLLDQRLLLILDEVANIAPLPSLQSIMSQGASQGVLVSWAAQSLNQLRDRFGAEQTESIFSAARAKLIFGGSSDDRDLERISRLLGEREIEQRSHSSGRDSWSQTISRQRQPRVTVADLRSIPPGKALLLYHTHRPQLVEAKIAARTDPFRSVMGWRGAGNGPVAPVLGSTTGGSNDG